MRSLGSAPRIVVESSSDKMSMTQGVTDCKGATGKATGKIKYVLCQVLPEEVVGKYTGVLGKDELTVSGASCSGRFID